MTDKNGKVISFINMKGGVGKTTLSIGIADYLSEKKELSVLIIDADPQFNSTQALLDEYKPIKTKTKKKLDSEGFLITETEEDDSESITEIQQEEENYYSVEVLPKQKTIYSLFRSQTNVNEVIETPKAENLIINLNKGLDILCGDLNLVLANKNGDYGLVKRLRNFILDNNLKKKYDYIIIDCPPTLTIYTESALMASDFYVIPNRIDRYSIIGIDSLQRAVSNLIREERIDLKCLGIIYTMVSNFMPVKEQNIQTNFESKKSVNDLDIFSSKSSIVNHIQYGLSGTLPTRYKSSYEDIEAISLELIDRINRYIKI